MPRQNKIILRNGTTTPSAGDFDIGEPAWDKTAGKLYVKNAAGSMVDIGAGGSSFTGGTLTNNLTVASGTTSLSPLTFQAGTNLTTAASGVFEYDGRAFYSTPADRGVSPSFITYRLNSDYAGSNSNTAQSFMGASPTLQANITYRFQASFRLLKTAGASSHTVGILFGGSCTVNNMYAILGWNRQSSTNADLAMSAFSEQTAYITTFNTNLVLTNAIATSSQVIVFCITGTVSVNTSGTFDMQYKLSAAPGGAYSTKAGSFIEIWPIGTGDANISVGSWA